MIHPDIVGAAEHLAGSEPASIPSDEAGLTEFLYIWYLNCTPLPEPCGPLLPIEINLPAAMRSAHAEATLFEGGWRAKTVSTWGRVVAKKGPDTRMLERADYTVPARPGLRAEPGDSLVVSRCWDWVDEEVGFWHLRRGAWPPEGADRLVRLYWNCTPADAPHVLHALTMELRRFPLVSSMMKTPLAPAHNGRADAFVLYLGTEGFSALEASLLKTAEDLQPHLRSAIPRLTFRFAPGVGLTEGALDGDSHGETRSRLIARTFLAAGPETRRSPDRLAAAIAAAFLAADLDPGRPYLEPGAVRDYAG
jgi:hypothetical protein